MTAFETAEMVRVLLDDQVDHFVTTPLLERVINWAQLDKIKGYIGADNELALRPLYMETRPLQDASNDLDGAVVRQAGATWPILLHPRTCKLWPTEGAVTASTVALAATYLEYGVYINYMQKVGTTLLHPTYTAGVKFPQVAYYTTRRTDVSGSNETIVYFTHTDTDQRAVLRYIAEPTAFDLTTPVPLALPAEYHPEVAAYAAQLLNTLDVGELERDTAALLQRGEQLPLSIAGGTI